MIAQTQSATRTYRMQAPAAVHSRRTAYLPGVPAPFAPHSAPAKATRTGPAADVRDLIDAAGPLSLRDIAGGTGIAPHEAAVVVTHLLAHGVLRRDEWGRHSLRPLFGDGD